MKVDDPETIRAAIEKERLEGCDKEQEQKGNNEEHKKRNLFVSCEEFMASEIDISWLVHGVIEENTLIQVFGKTGSYKSFITTDLGLSVATGKSWHNHAVKQGYVVFIVGEGHFGLKRRFRAWETANQVKLKNWHISRRAADLYSAVGQTEVMSDLVALNVSPSLVIVDTLARNIGAGDENSSKDVNQVFRFLDALREKFGCAAIIVHHTGHKEPDRARGSSGLPANVDYDFQVKKNDRKAEVICKKTKDGEPLKPLTFELRTVELGRLDDGTIVNSLVPFLIDGEKQKHATGFELRGARKIAFNALTECLSEDSSRLPCSDNVKERVGALLAPKFVVSEEIWRQRCVSLGIAEGTEKAKKVAFTRAKSALLDLEKVQTWEGFYWI